VELTDPRIIEALLAGLARDKQPKPAPKPQGVRRSSPVRCQCGQCPRCADNLKWEVIFNQKFADPDYYKTRPVRHCSALD
jgi:hypothetical protein